MDFELVVRVHFSDISSLIYDCRCTQLNLERRHALTVFTNIQIFLLNYIPVTILRAISYSLGHYKRATERFL